MESKNWWLLAQILLVTFIIFSTYDLINQFPISATVEEVNRVSFLIDFSSIALLLIAFILYRLKHKAGFYLSLLLSTIFGSLAFVVLIIASALTWHINTMLGNPENLVALRSYANLISTLVIAGFILLAYSIWKSRAVFNQTS